jgi:hypothetical protein
MWLAEYPRAVLHYITPLRLTRLKSELTALRTLRTDAQSLSARSRFRKPAACHNQSWMRGPVEASLFRDPFILWCDRFTLCN